MPSVVDRLDLPAPATSGAQDAFRILLGAVLVFAGVSHLTVSRTEFQAQVPGWVPLDPDLVVIVSGLAEISLGLALVFLVRHRVLVGLVAGAFFVAIFPGNISQYIDGDDGFGLDTDTARAVRLLFQPVLVAWALWCSGAWEALTSRGRTAP